MNAEDAEIAEVHHPNIGSLRTCALCVADRILLADRVDGKPLPASEAPWRLIIPGDQRPARSARQVVTVRVLSDAR